MNSIRAVESKEDMVIPALPCYGGPLDGSFFPVKKCPENYKVFIVRGKEVFLYMPIHVEHLNFDILNQAAKAKPKDYNLGEEYP